MIQIQSPSIRFAFSSFLLCTVIVFSGFQSLESTEIQVNEDSTGKIKKEYLGYVADKEEILNEDLSVFVSYSEEYRPAGFELDKFVFKISSLESTGYRPKVFFSKNAKDGIENYQANESLKLFYNVQKNTAYRVYVYENNLLKFLKEYSPSELKSGKLNLHKSINLYHNGSAGKVVDHPTFLVVPSKYSEIIQTANQKDEIESENQSKPEGLDFKYIPVNGSPYDASKEDQFGPSSHSSMYGTRPQIVLHKNPDGGICIAWKDSEKENLHLTELNSSLEIKNELSIKMKFPLFGGYSKDDSGNYYIVFARENRDGDFRANISLMKYSPTGKQLGNFDLPIDRENFDVMSPISAASSRVLFADGKVAVHMGKTQHKNKSDGLNHQSAIFFVVDSNTMKMDTDLSTKWVASHSFDQRLLFDGKDFVTLDLADNFPRGFSLRKPSGSRVIFTYKTQHIKGENRSNDNNTYSELGGLANDESGYLVLGSSEKSFDNKVTGKYLNESRNLFMLLVDYDFPSKEVLSKDGKRHSNLVNPEIIISEGENSKEIFFYDYGGGKNYQQRVGVVWLTDYSDSSKENVARPKLVKLGMNKFMALWEKWSANSYEGTYYTVFNSHGDIIKKKSHLGNYRINRGDEIIEWNGKALWVTGKKDYKSLKIITLEDTKVKKTERGFFNW
ncbi:MAG: hypothetical protein H7A24_09815 [Leptospiraceae bacterium]|nr:hypothetical protein [Leptospiraceae bacterium]MCP5512166.1 hypothetical protein [Leptospiraceae bacterium]